MNNQTNTNNTIKEENYLVTQAVDTNTISVEEKSKALNLLQKAEEKSMYKANIAKGIKEPQIKVAVSALKLSNPFKGY
ncbi:MAG: hypothetical protein ACOX6Q_02925 [Candidatus Dojkabacteria bacterium]